MDADRVWLIIAAIYGGIAIVGGLGEYVFGWWDQPFDWLAPLSAILSFAAIGWSASARQMRREHRDLQRALEQLADGQKRLLEGQQSILDGQQKLLDGQAEQTRLLREVVTSFRRP